MKEIPTKNSGDYGRADEFNPDMIEEMQNLIKTTGMSLNENDNTQISKAISSYIGCGDFYLDDGIADQYSLIPSGDFIYPSKYINGQTVRFKALNSNTGVSVLEIKPDGVTSLGFKEIKRTDGTNLQLGDILINQYVEVIYNNINDCFNLFYAQIEDTNPGLLQILYKEFPLFSSSTSANMQSSGHFNYKFGFGVDAQELNISFKPISNNSIIEYCLSSAIYITNPARGSTIGIAQGVIGVWINPETDNDLSVNSLYLSENRTIYAPTPDSAIVTLGNPFDLKFYYQNKDALNKNIKIKFGSDYPNLLTTIGNAIGVTSQQYKTTTSILIKEYSQ